MDVVSKLNAFWCAITHAGGRIERDSEGRINWRCATCGRWSDYPVPIDEECRSTDAAIAHYITTATADTARAMHAAEMRGQDMQDAPERIWVTSEDHGASWSGSYRVFRASDLDHGEDYPEYTRTDLCITDAECQRRIDAAVLVEREAAKSLVWTLGHEIRAAMLVDEDNEQTVLDMVKATAAAIRARVQK